MAAAWMGCGKDASVTVDSDQITGRLQSKIVAGHLPTNKVPPKRVSNRAANPDGLVFIVEYHHIRDGKSTMERSPADFRKDLDRLFQLGFRPISMSDYLSGRISIPAGASPVVFTFDDANPSQFQLNSDLSVDPSCAIGIWQDFASSHPDFPVKATFFVLPQMWGQPAMRSKKVEMLENWGCELGNHTTTHPNLRKLTDEQVKAEIAGGAALLERYGVTGPNLLALPLGISPKNRRLLRGFDRNGPVALRATFLVGANPALPVDSPKFDSTRIPRIQACKGPYGLDDWLDQVEKGKVKVYVAP
ncbi:MAG: polysaccharide deacetylase family protein [Fimbriimonadaceae bacterium]|nr:polysaccharide deacetylase family protein [Fimbriimonadaceae bacterium]